ncbi:NUDIX domain-containing protein [Streptomyces sp. NPDC059122]|uniref:NUDIX domain-containing protein n=1 Tax=Streptomyces sp. NPDC059122 TaxID=3346732 RepID=UPI0036B59CD3
MTDQFLNPDGRRIGLLALFRNAEGRPLLLRKRDREHQPWSLPGGCAVGGEPPTHALRRKVYEETGLEARPGLVLALHYMPANPETAEGYNLVVDCGELPNNTHFRLKDDEFSAHGFIPVNQLTDHAQPHTAARTRSALRTLKAGGGIELLEAIPLLG